MNNFICLVMIVKNESSIIERCLNSIVNVISSYFICDIGSTDNTIEIIENFMKNNLIPGKIITKEWKDFTYNRNYLFEQAYTNDTKYLLWIDADEILLNNQNQYLNNTDKKKLLNFLDNNMDIGIFNLLTNYEEQTYWRWNIVRNNQLFQWECPVHEYLIEFKPTKSTKIDFIKLIAKKDGNCSKQNNLYKKDVKNYLKEKPNEPRAIFYLAQTYQENNKEQKAITYYKLRIKIKAGYKQERYISALRLGRIYKNKNKKEKALKVWNNAKKISPKRLEIPFEIMLITDNKKEAYSIGLSIFEKYERSDDDLFVENKIYDWIFLMEFSVVAYYAEEYEQAYRFGKQLLDENKLPSNNLDTAKENIKFYKTKMGIITEDNNLLVDFNIKPPTVIILDNFLKNPDEVRKFALSQDFNIKDNFSGLRTESFAKIDHKHIFEKLLYNKITYWSKESNGSFQYTNVSNIHQDLTDFTAIIYLTPNIPSNNNNCEIIDKYNRLIIFNSKYSNIYFGDSKDNGKLIQIFFFS